MLLVDVNIINLRETIKQNPNIYINDVKHSIFTLFYIFLQSNISIIAEKYLTIHI